MGRLAGFSYPDVVHRLREPYSVKQALTLTSSFVPEARPNARMNSSRASARGLGHR
jgi:hypothetical protein